MIDLNKLPESIIQDIASNMGIEEKSKEEIKEAFKWLSPDEAFEKFCEWNGIIGYASMLSSALDKIREASK